MKLVFSYLWEQCVILIISLEDMKILVIKGTMCSLPCACHFNETLSLRSIKVAFVISESFRSNMRKEVAIKLYTPTIR